MQAGYKAYRQICGDLMKMLSYNVFYKGLASWKLSSVHTKRVL